MDISGILSKLIFALIIMAFLSPWFINFYKFTNCDFERNYKCELIHGAGIIIAPMSYITVWFDTDK